MKTKVCSFFPCNCHSEMFKICFFTVSQNHRMVGVGRDLCGSSSPALLLKQGHLEQAAQDLVQAGLQYLQRGRIHDLPGQPVPVLRHPQREEVPPHVQTELPVPQFVPNLINTGKSSSHEMSFQLQVMCSICMLYCADLFLHVNPSAYNSYRFSCLNSPNTAHHCGLIININTQLIQFLCPFQLLLWHSLF